MSLSDHLEDAPVYLLLDRLRFHGLAWYFRDDILHITTPEVARENQVTVPYPVGDLFDQGIKPETLHEVITSTVAPEHWEEVGGAGVLGQLGDVMLIRQTDEWQRNVQGLLAAGAQSWSTDICLRSASTHCGAREVVCDRKRGLQGYAAG